MLCKQSLCAANFPRRFYRAEAARVWPDNVATWPSFWTFQNIFHKILELNPQEKFARIEPGIVLDDLRAEAEKSHLTFAPDPSTHNHCTLGGMIGNNSCGVHSVMGGKTVDNIEELEILTYDGLRMRVGQNQR